MDDTQKPDTQNATDKKLKVSGIVLNVVGIILCVMLVPILLINCTLIIKGMIYPDEVPSLFGQTPLIVLTESMEPDIMAGDIIVCEEIDVQQLKKGDVIAFFDPASKGSSIVTHKINEVYKDSSGNVKEFETYGINNKNLDGSQAYDRLHVPAENVVGIYRGTRIAGMGHVAIFMQSTWGLILCVGVPVLLVIAYEVLRRRIKDKQSKSDIADKQKDIDALKAELEALKAQQTQSTDSQPDKETENKETENKDEQSNPQPKVVS